MCTVSCEAVLRQDVHIFLMWAMMGVKLTGAPELAADVAVCCRFCSTLCSFGAALGTEAYSDRNQNQNFDVLRKCRGNLYTSMSAWSTSFSLALESGDADEVTDMVFCRSQIVFTGAALSSQQTCLTSHCHFHIPQ